MAKESMASLRELLVFSRRFRHLTKKGLAAVACGAISSALQLLLPLSSVVIINKVLPAQDFGLLFKVAAILAVSILLSMLAAYGQFYFSAVFRERMALELQRDLLEHVLRLPVRFFRTHDDGYLMSRILGDSEQAIEFTAGLTTVGRTLIWLLTATVLVPSFHLTIGLGILAIIPLYVVVLMVFNSKIRRQFTVVQERSARSSRELHQALAGVNEIKAYCAEKFRTRRYLSTVIQRTRSLISGRQLMALAQYSTQIIVVAVSLFILVFGGMAVMKGTLSLGGLVALNALAGYVLTPVNDTVNQVFSAQKSLAAIERLNEVLNREHEGASSLGARPLQAVRGQLRFEKVRFDYDPAEPVLRGVDLEILAGETVLLIGPSGEGKTTLVSLLPRFFDPDHGCILLDNRPVERIRLHQLRSQIAFVSQDTFLFSDSIYNNIRLGRPAASREEVLEAARLAKVQDFAEKFEQGLDSEVGERGCRLSGGQRQRISIARALLKNAPILILDEASSAVDGETEAVLHEALSELMHERTTVIIAHHASNFLDQVDRVLELKNGILRQVPHAAVRTVA